MVTCTSKLQIKQSKRNKYKYRWNIWFEKNIIYINKNVGSDKSANRMHVEKRPKNREESSVEYTWSLYSFKLLMNFLHDNQVMHSKVPKVYLSTKYMRTEGIAFTMDMYVINANKVI